jgi:hypothetical protein
MCETIVLSGGALVRGVLFTALALANPGCDDDADGYGDNTGASCDVADEYYC